MTRTLLFATATATLCVACGTAPLPPPVPAVVDRGVAVGPGWHPAWSAAAARELVAVVQAAERDGLRPQDYPVDSILALLGGAGDADDVAALDGLLSRTFLRYARHLALGRFSPADVDSMWTAAPAALDFTGALKTAIDSHRVSDVLRGLAPPHPGYARLRAARERYRDDPARALQIDANLERWRWIPRELGSPYVMVNIAASSLDVVEGGRIVHTARVIVGRPDWRTPLTTTPLTHVVFHPSWYIPRTIALAEIIPAQVRDSTYLARMGIRVFDMRSGRAVDPATVDWRAVTERTLAHRFVQDPGPANPLGTVRFQLVNDFGVMLHDTPNRELFAGAGRALSHGCVRVDQARAVADLLLAAVPGWTADSTTAALARRAERAVALPRAVPVVLAYWTVWVDDAGVVQFRDDVYGWDARLAAMLGPPLPSLSSSRTSASAVCEKSR